MTPFQLATIPQSEVDQLVVATIAEIRKDPVGYRKLWQFDPDTPESEIIGIITNTALDTVYLNDTYQVHYRKMEPLPGSNLPPMVHLSIRRLDREPIRDWRDMQQIKSELVGEECEGAELYPAESRVVDTSNQYHLWVLADPKSRFPFGFSQGGKIDSPFSKSKQRPFAATP